MNIGIIDKRSIWVEGVFYILKSNFEQYNIYRFEEYDEMAHMMTSSEIDILICSEDYMVKYKRRTQSANRVKYIIVFTSSDSTSLPESEGIIYLDEKVNKNVLVTTICDLVTEDDIIGSSIELTNREYNLLYLLSLGYSNREIGKKLYIAEKTVKNNLTEMYKKLGLKNRYDAIQYYDSKNKM